MGREIAEELEQQHPRWIVIFGAFTREFVCIPRFAAPHGLMVVAIYPKAAADRMSKVERLSRVREGLRKTGQEDEQGMITVIDDATKRSAVMNEV